MKKDKAMKFNENQDLITQAMKKIEQGINQLEKINHTSTSSQEICTSINDITDNISLAIKQLQTLEQNLQTAIAEKYTPTPVKEKPLDKIPSSITQYKEQHESLKKSA